MLYVKNLYKSYQTGKNKYQVLNGVDFCVEKGEFVAVMIELDAISPSIRERSPLAALIWRALTMPDWRTFGIRSSVLSFRISCS